MIKFSAVALFLAVLIVTPAIAEDGLSPHSVPGAESIDVSRAKVLFDQGALFVDVRTEKDWEAGRIPGAEHLELKSGFTEAALRRLASNDDPVVIYCNGPRCLRSSQASAMAVEWGFTSVRYFRDGFPAWQGSGYPVE